MRRHPVKAEPGDYDASRSLHQPVEAVTGVAETGDDVAVFVESLIDGADDEGDVATLREAFDGGDTRVYQAYLPLDYTFYLRFHVSAEDDPQPGAPVGTLNFTGSPELVSGAREALRHLGVGLEIVAAQTYFDERYGG